MKEYTVTSKGQVVIPSYLRKKYGIDCGTKVFFIEQNDCLVLQPISNKSIEMLCGIFKSCKKSVTKELLAERKKEKQIEEVKFAKRRS